MTSQSMNQSDSQINTIQNFQKKFVLNETDLIQSQLLFSRLQESSPLMSVFDTIVFIFSFLKIQGGQRNSPFCLCYFHGNSFFRKQTRQQRTFSE
jgi:hypothetical protein